MAAHHRKTFQTVFNDFDVDGSGQLDAEEVLAAFKTLGFEFTQKQVLTPSHPHILTQSHPDTLTCGQRRS